MTDENKGWNNGPSMWASLCHFSALLGAVWWIPVKGMWIPCGQIIAPLGVWLIKRKTSHNSFGNFTYFSITWFS
ncbi:MAG: DUF4870 domain-containing protein [Deltaproteobacteria bacterium]|nr:DUF4870 domain-containing protein [Deltaproteobacteria bacterium]